MLSITKLMCERDDRVLFQSLDYRFPSGSITQLEGKNGAGKSTLLRILAGLYTSYAGKVLWGDSLLSSSKIEFNSQMLFIGHRSAIKSTLTPLENLRFLMGLQQSFTEEALFEALDKVGLFGYEEVLCRNLSAGQQRRVALARLYLTNASVWLLDEIFTAIDKEGVLQLESFLYQKARAGVTIILTTHHQLDIPGLQTLNLGHYALQHEADA